MKTFLIDLENVKNQGLVGVELLAPEDRVFIFYSESANSLSIPIIQAMNNSRAQIEYVRLQRSGRNAMDFQIVALLGFLIGSERKGLYCIVSQDNGYLAPVEFFMDHAADQLDVNVLLSSSIQKGIRKWGSLALESAPALPEAPEVVLVVEEAPEAAKETGAEEEKSSIRSKVRNIRRPRRSKHEDKEEVAQDSARPAESEAKKGKKTKNNPKTDKAPAKEEIKEEKTGAQEEAPQEELVEKRDVQKAAASEEKTVSAEDKDTGKRRGRPRKETAEASKAKTEKKREYKQVEVPQEFLERVHGIVEGHTSEEQKKYDKVVAQAILSTKAKNEFYQFFRRALGVQKGGDLYRAVRGDYEKLKAAAAVNRHEDGEAE